MASTEVLTCHPNSHLDIAGQGKSSLQMFYAYIMPSIMEDFTAHLYANQDSCKGSIHNSQIYSLPLSITM